MRGQAVLGFARGAGVHRVNYGRWRFFTPVRAPNSCLAWCFSAGKTGSITPLSPAIDVAPGLSYNIFNEAMCSVLAIMETNFSAAFKRTEAFKTLEKSVQAEAEELERLNKVRILAGGMVDGGGRADTARGQLSVAFAAFA